MKTRCGASNPRPIHSQLMTRRSHFNNIRRLLRPEVAIEGGEVRAFFAPVLS